MEKNEFQKIFAKRSLQIINTGIRKGYFEQEDEKRLTRKLLQVVENGIETNIDGTAVYGMYVYETIPKKLYYNAKVFENEKEALIYIIHEIKHALDEDETNIGFEEKEDNIGVGMNEGASHRFATDIAEEILGEKIILTRQKCLGVEVDTNLDEYQIEDKMNEIMCKALGISRGEFLIAQNEKNRIKYNNIQQKFNQFANFDIFRKSLDDIYAIQEETWFDKNGRLLEKEASPTQEQIFKTKEAIRKCQSQIMQYVMKSNIRKLEEIQKEMIVLNEKIME